MEIFYKAKKLATDKASELIDKNLTTVSDVINTTSEFVDKAIRKTKEGKSEKEFDIETSSQVIRIDSLEQMEEYLISLQSNASVSLTAALAAQLQVINYVSSPQLLDSTFDLFFQNLKKSLDYAEDDQMKNDIKEKCTLMVQNYVFFMNAKLTYAIQENKKEGQKLLETAGTILTKTVQDLTRLAVTSGISGTSTILSIAENIFQTDKKGKNILERAISWWGKAKENKRKQSDFYKSLSSLIQKLHKHKDLIGKTNLISGLIENYAKDLAEYEMPEATREIVAELEKMQREKVLRKKQFIRLMWVTPILGCVLLGILSGGKDEWFEAHFIWILILMLIPASIYFIWNWNTNKRITDLEIAQSQTHNYLLKKYGAIANDFEE